MKLILLITLCLLLLPGIQSTAQTGLLPMLPTDGAVAGSREMALSRWNHRTETSFHSPGCGIAGSRELRTGGKYHIYTATLWEDFASGQSALAALVVVFLLLAAYSLYLQRSKRRETQRRQSLEIENKLIGMELQALNLSINPHFMGNALNSIQYYFNSDAKREEANNYLSKFGALIRRMLQDAQSEFISLEDELERLRIYLQLEQIRIGNNLLWSINVDEALDTDLVQIPVMMIQPYVENAIWHGISTLKEPGQVKIDLCLADKHFLRIDISDNGIGIRNSSLRKSKHADYRPRLGMLFTEERLQLLQQSGKRHVTLEINELDSSSPDRPGTRVRLLVALQPAVQPVHTA